LSARRPRLKRIAEVLGLASEAAQWRSRAARISRSSISNLLDHRRRWRAIVPCAGSEPAPSKSRCGPSAPARQRRGGAPHSMTADAPSRHPVVLRIDQDDGGVGFANTHVPDPLQHRPSTECGGCSDVGVAVRQFHVALFGVFQIASLSGCLQFFPFARRSVRIDLSDRSRRRAVDDPASNGCPQVPLNRPSRSLPAMFMSIGQALSGFDGAASGAQEAQGVGNRTASP
jgi:hypothetical protein